MQLDQFTPGAQSGNWTGFSHKEWTKSWGSVIQVCPGAADRDPPEHATPVAVRQQRPREGL